MEAAPVLAIDVLKAAIAAEMLISNQKGNLKLPTKIFAVKKETEHKDKEFAEEDDKEDDILDAINAIRIQRGKQPFKKIPPKDQKFNGNGNRNGASSRAHPKMPNGEPMKCRYCNKSRHMQKECYKRIKEN